MPLLRKKIFQPVQPPSNLTDKDKVFYCELTGEAFEDYDEFFQRMILCNSLVWSCERTGRHSLTYKEALECEEKANKVLTNIPAPVQVAILHAVHNMRNGKVGDLANDVYLFLKSKPLPGESVEVNINRTWRKGTIVSIVSKETSPKKNTPSKASLKSPIKGAKMIGGFNHDHLISFLNDRKPIEISCNVDVDGKVHVVSSKRIRRPANELNREVVKLFIRKCCVRSTINSDDGYWRVLDDLVDQYGLGEPMNDIKRTVKSKKRKLSQKDLGSPNSSPKKRKSSSGNETPKTKQKESEKKNYSAKKSNSNKKQENTASSGKKTKALSAEQIQKMKEAERLKKLVKKEEEKEARKLEREKDREELSKIKQLETDFLKRWNLVQEDLILEDSKVLPESSAVECRLPESVLGDALMVLEFLNNFGPLFNIKCEVSCNLDFMTFENGLSERNTDGTFYEILRFLLVTYLRVSNEENSTDAESAESSDSETPQANDDNEQPDESQSSAAAASANATAIAAWPLLCQGTELHELIIDQFSLTEVLRIHLLSSGVRIGCGRFEWQKKGGFQYTDDPGVEFRHKEEFILRSLSQGSVYDLPVEDKLKLLVLLCNQLLMLVTTREYIDEAYDNVKELKKQLRELRHAERKRKKDLAVERYKKRVEQRAVEKQAALGRIQKTKEEPGTAQESLPVDPVEPPHTDPPNRNGITHDDQLELTEEEIEKLDGVKSKQFRDKENHLIKDLNKWTAIYSKTPLGHDRSGRSCWTFQSINGLYIEESNHIDDFIDLHTSPCLMESTNTEETDEDIAALEQNLKQKQLLSELSKNHENPSNICQLLMKRYDCDSSLPPDVVLSKSKVIKQIVCSVSEQTTDLNPKSCSRNTWSVYHHSEDVPALINALNERGIRECQLKAALVQQKDLLSSSIGKCELFQPLPKTGSRAGLRSETIDKSCFQSMDDFVEAALCEQLLDLEEKIWNASLGVTKTDDRDQWRESLDQNIATLLGKGKTDQLPSNRVNGEAIEHSINGTVGSDEPQSTTPIAKLILSNTNQNEGWERCSTPIIDNTSNEQLEMVQHLANRLLQIERGVQRKFLNAPLGDGTEADEAGRERACLERWEESLKNVSNLSQIFIHLNTLDRSITWNKSILNTRCKLCRRKGDAEQMLLCDSCDRGFHMYCLKPPISNVPDGDWFCKDCQPKQIIRTPVKSKRRSSAIPSDDDDSASNSESEQDNDDDEDIDRDVESEQNDTADESDHGETCSVCNLDGTLMCCDMCPRVYHVSCTYPPMRKVPRGAWACQVCTGLDGDLPKSKRVVTVEKQRAMNGSPDESSPSKKRKRSPVAKSSKKTPSSTSIDSSAANKRRKIDLVNVTRKPILDPSQMKKSRRDPSVFGRQERRICSQIIDGLIKHEDAEPFLAPVDTDAVPDYSIYVTTPMDLSTVKRKTNTGGYETMQSFLDDIKLVFDNCLAYNSMRSNIGKAGNRLRKFFESKLVEFELS